MGFISWITFCFITSQTNSLLYVKNAQHVNIAPLDKTVFVGERWTFKCTVKPKVVIDTVRLRIVSTKSNFTWSVPPSDLKVLNKSTVSASVEIVDEFRVDPTVECLDGFGRVLRSGFFFVERPVQNITDFTGIYLYEKYVNMTWSLNQDYMKVEDIGVQLCWSDDRDFRSSRCGGSPLRYFVIDEADLNRKPYTIHVRVTVYHKHWNRRPVDMDSSTIILDTNATSEHRINMYNATKSDPPVDLQVTTRNSSCISVTWEYPMYLNRSYTKTNKTDFYYNVNCRLHNSMNSTMSYGQFIQQTLPITICGLRPFSEYDVSVRVRRVDVQPWSEWSTLTTVTDEDTPLIGPLLTSTSFYTRGCSIGRREIFVYWQKPNRLELQGHLTGFEVEVQPDIKVSFEKNLESTRNYAHFLTLDCDLEYNISVYSTTKVGRSQSPSVIFVPKYNKNSKHVAGFQIEDFLNSTRKLHVTWEPFTLSNATLVVYTCHENTIPETCSNDYTHIEVDASVGSLHLDRVDSKEIMFGYALKLASGQSGGLEWTQCVYNRRNKPREPLGLQVVQGKDFGSLDITWNPEPCNKKTQVLVQSYTIYVCDGNTKPSLEKCQKLNHRATDNIATVSSLKDDHVYNVTIQAVTPFNLSGDVASFKVGRTKYRYGEAIILIIVFVIVGIVLILASVVYCTSKCCNSKKKFVGMSQWFTDDIIKENKSPTLTDGKGPIGGETVMASAPQMPTQRSESSSTTSDEGISSNTSDDGPEPQEPYVHMAQTTDEPITPTTESQTSSLRPNNGPPPFEVYNTEAGEMGEQVGETGSELSDVVVVVLAGGQGGCDPGAINSEIDAGLNVSTGCDSQNDITDNQQTPGYVVIAEMNNGVNVQVDDSQNDITDNQQTPGYVVIAEMNNGVNVQVDDSQNDITDNQQIPGYVVIAEMNNQESSNGQPYQYSPDYQSNNGQSDQYSPDYQSNNGQSAQYSTDYQSNNGHSHPESNDYLHNGHLHTSHSHSGPSPDNNQNVSLDQTNHHVLGQMSSVNENQTFSLVSHQMPQHFSDPSLCSNDQSHYESDMPSLQNRLSSESCSASSNDSLSSSENDILTFVNRLNLSPTNTTECVNSQSLPNTNTVLDENGQSTLGNYQTSFQNYTLTSDIDRTSQSTLMIPNINNYIASQYHHNPTECNTSPSSNC